MDKLKKSDQILTPANVVTIIGMLLVIYSYYLAITGEKLKAFIFFIIAVLTDWLDGTVARSKIIQKIFKGRGVSDLGKLLDPIRDTMLRAIVFILAYLSSINLILPGVIALGTFLIFWFYNRKINKNEKAVTVSPNGKRLHAVDCFVISIWFLSWAKDLSILELHDKGLFALLILSLTAFMRFIVYQKDYRKIKK